MPVIFNKKLLILILKFNQSINFLICEIKQVKNIIENLKVPKFTILSNIDTWHNTEREGMYVSDMIYFLKIFYKSTDFIHLFGANLKFTPYTQLLSLQRKHTVYCTCTYKYLVYQ